MIELMVTLTIISLLAALALPGIKSVRRRASATAIGNDLRQFAAAFDAYAHETGTWPAESAAGVFPTDMTNRMYASAWLKPTILGGQYNWDYQQVHAGTRIQAAIAISDTAAAPFVQDIDLLESIDKIIDDGNLATGNFRLGADDEPVFIVSP
jgi:type II secretory pathway pseudopilin PulG